MLFNFDLLVFFVILIKFEIVVKLSWFFMNFVVELMNLYFLNIMIVFCLSYYNSFIKINVM